MNKLSLQDQLIAVHVWISKHPTYSVFAPLTQVGESKIVEGLPTAGTDGWNKYYGAEFFAGLTKEERRFLVLHELSHQARMHSTLYTDLNKENKQMANMAMDYSINNDLIAMDAGAGEIKFIDGGCEDKQYLHWDVRRIYRALKQDQKNGKGQGGGSLDSHDFEEDQGSGSGDKPDAQMQAQRVMQALEQGKLLSEKIQKAMGKGSGNASALVDNLWESQIDWRRELEDFVCETCSGDDLSTWSRPNRRFAADDMITLPTLYSEAVDKIVIGFDTSGSCFGGEEMQAFVGEVAALIERVKPKVCVVAYVDWDVVGAQEFTDGQFAVQSMNIQGGGGTDLEKLYPWMEKNGHADAQAVIWLTDGYTSFTRAPSMPVLWCMTTHVRAPYGKNIQIKV